MAFEFLAQLFKHSSAGRLNQLAQCCTFPLRLLIACHLKLLSVNSFVVSVGVSKRPRQAKTDYRVKSVFITKNPVSDQYHTKSVGFAGAQNITN
jgi:hypothetical protein